MKNKLLLISLITLLNTTGSYAESYQVKPGDNLSTIATNYKYAGITTEQMMNAIYSINPSAFASENINVLKLGVSLQIPENNAELQKLLITSPRIRSKINSTNKISEEIAEIKKEIRAVMNDIAVSQKVLEKNISNL